MKKLVMSVICSGLLFGLSTAGGLVEISDNELDSVYAQGFNFTINTDNLRTFNVGENIYNVDVGDITVNDGGLQFNLDSSLVLSGNAQQNAFMPINIVDSAVNIPINIIVIKGDNNGTINISNLLNSFNKSNIGM
ncbi:hypothetical protein SAMN06265182_0157 [Persephonella hydrogeniphila]|uniref:Uncharacterized protein n=1 Tax=Persephonella hydrogeniphila TaxID=198703 RepID=A0A285MZG5_9AQUI|nr:hypothetical protein [Persephonella hydrogeniphila]SNZ02585.1 hypothetical protein SAMN06265182_0157 [Persephonella hydrogeniphila]